MKELIYSQENYFIDLLQANEGSYDHRIRIKVDNTEWIKEDSITPKEWERMACCG